MPKKNRSIRDWIKKIIKRLSKGKGVEVQVGIGIFIIFVVVLYFLLR